MLRDRCGASAVTFAAVAPILIGMLLALFDYGNGFFESMGLQSAARAGAQYALANPDDVSGITTVVAGATNLDPAELTIGAVKICGCADGSPVACGTTPACDDGSAKRTFVTVSVTKAHDPVVRFPFAESVPTLSASASVRVK